MRYILIFVLVVVPIALGSWILTRAAPAPENSPKKKTTDVTATPAPASKADEDAALKALLKMPLAGSTIDGDIAFYDAQGLFEYINGAAPIFIERNFRKLAAVDLKTSDGGELTCDIYDMQNAENAASIYAKERPASASNGGIGQTSHRGSMSLVMQQDRYYVKLTAFDTGAEALLPSVAKVLVERMQ